MYDRNKEMKKFIILIPVYNDWKSVFKLLENIDLQITKWDAEVSVLIVNDASTEERVSAKLNYKNLKSVRVMNMKTNQGHARCNATGLKFSFSVKNFNPVALHLACPWFLFIFITRTDFRFV